MTWAAKTGAGLGLGYHKKWTHHRLQDSTRLDQLRSGPVLKRCERSRMSSRVDRRRACGWEAVRSEDSTSGCWVQVW